MRCRNNGVGVQEGSTAEVRSAFLKTNNEGESACRGGFSSNDIFMWRNNVCVNFWNGGGETSHWERKCDEEIFELHPEWEEWCSQG